MTIEEVKKECSGCGIVKDEAKFDRDKRQAGGRRPDCKKCRNIKYKLSQKKMMARIDPVIIEAETKKPEGKIFCRRSGRMMNTKHCVPGCNDACMVCENAQMQNIGAGSDTLTPEEDKEAMIAGTWGSSSAIAVNEGHSEL